MEVSNRQTAVDFSNTEIAFSNKSDKELKKTARLFKLMNNAALVSVGSKVGLWANDMQLPFTESIFRRRYSINSAVVSR